MNEIDNKLHAAIHEHMMSIPPENIFSRRVGIFDYLENALGLRVTGNVFDIGCGSGYASIWLAKNKSVSKVYAQEASLSAVEQLLPRNIAYHGVQNLVEPILGSFDAIPFKNQLDFVVSFGALHHSPCLFSTMKSISGALKNGGYLIAQEPVMPNTTTNQQYIDKYNVIENRFGMSIRNGDRNDNFFREAEYIAAASFAGLDLIFYEDFSTKKTLWGSLRAYLSRVKKLLLQGGLRDLAGKIIHKLSGRTQHSENKMDAASNSMSAHIRTVMPKILVFRKNDTEYVPHLWAQLKPPAGQ